MMTPILSAAGLREVEASLGVEFADSELLRQALVHSSFVTEFPGVFEEANERLEFLGDAVIDLSVAHTLIERFPDRHEGHLTQMRSALVNGASLATVAARMGLGSWLVMGRGERELGGMERPSNLADAFEALVGALFLDQGYDAARDFVLRAMREELDSAAEMREPPRHPKSLLHEAAMERRLSPPEYKVISRTGPDHDPTFTAQVLLGGEAAGSGEGNSKQAAESMAAQDALARLSRE